MADYHEVLLTNFFHRLSQSGLTVSFASGRSFREAEGDMTMSLSEQQSPGMTTGRTVVDIDRWECYPRRAGSCDEAGKLPLKEPLLHGFTRAKRYPDGGA